jgi:hypothetical protein
MTSSVKFRDLWWSPWKFRNLMTSFTKFRHPQVSLSKSPTAKLSSSGEFFSLTSVALPLSQDHVGCGNIRPSLCRYSDMTLRWSSMPYVYWCALVWSSGRGDDMNWLVRKYCICVCCIIELDGSWHLHASTSTRGYCLICSLQSCDSY